MSPSAEFDMGSEVACSDGVCGVLSRVVVNPVGQEVTHLVVEPRHRAAQGHLVPIRFVKSGGERIELSCTQAQFGAFESAVETDYLPAPRDVAGYPASVVFVQPFWGLVTSPLNRPLMSSGLHPTVKTVGSVPLGEVDVRRGEFVHATDGDIGRIDGLVIDPDSHHVTHILLQEGHLFGHKRVAIPISAVTRVDQLIKLTLSKEEVRDLPAVDAAHPLA